MIYCIHKKKKQIYTYLSFFPHFVPLSLSFPIPAPAFPTTAIMSTSRMIPCGGHGSAAAQRAHADRVFPAQRALLLTRRRRASPNPWRRDGECSAPILLRSILRAPAFLYFFQLLLYFFLSCPTQKEERRSARRPGINSFALPAIQEKDSILLLPLLVLLLCCKQSIILPSDPSSEQRHRPSPHTILLLCRLLYTKST